MPPSGHLLEFTITAFVLIVVPGPSVLFVVSRGVALGRRAALATVAGNTGGVLVQAVLVALGLGAIVERSDAVFTAIKLAGAVYLMVLGVRMIRRRRPLADLTDATQVPKGTRTIVREGFVVGLTNPKAVDHLHGRPAPVHRPGPRPRPTAAAPARRHLPHHRRVSDSAWAIAAGTARGWLARSRGRLEAIAGAGGLVLIGLGVRLAVTGRRD